jgi:hypothetical protein
MLAGMGVRTGTDIALDLGIICAILTIPCAVLFRGKGMRILWGASGLNCLVWLLYVIA